MYFLLMIIMLLTGTENRADDEGRQEVAVEKETGGSYVVSFSLFTLINKFNFLYPAKLLWNFSKTYETFILEVSPPLSFPFTMES